LSADFKEVTQIRIGESEVEGSIDAAKVIMRL
jgi:hypothetical protein